MRGMASMKDLLKINVEVKFDHLEEELTVPISDPELAHLITALAAAAGPLPAQLWSGPKTIEQNIAAALYQDDDAHDTCTADRLPQPAASRPLQGLEVFPVRRLPGSVACAGTRPGREGQQDPPREDRA